MLKKDELTAKIIEIRDKRSHCQCSRDKIVEKLSFDRVLSTLDRYGDEIDCEELTAKWKLTAESIELRNKDAYVLKNAYLYGVAIAEKLNGLV